MESDCLGVFKALLGTIQESMGGDHLLYLDPWKLLRLFPHDKIPAHCQNVYLLRMNMYLIMLMFWWIAKSRFCGKEAPRISFLQFSRKINILRLMLLHKLEINAAFIALYEKFLRPSGSAKNPKKRCGLIWGPSWAGWVSNQIFLRCWALDMSIYHGN